MDKGPHLLIYLIILFLYLLFQFPINRAGNDNFNEDRGHSRWSSP